ncbi:MAG: stage II sporulation protein R [Oscillospiraceae bacterium]
MFKTKIRSLKLWETALLIALSLTTLAALWAQGRQNSLSEKLVRFHVIAVSDDEYEQQLKLRVRDAVLEYISPKLEEAESSTQAREILAAELDNIREAAQTVSEGRGVTVTLTRENYPTKSYEGFTLPAGEYESLRVILGEGQGHNWWCIVFPPVCLSAAQADTVEQQLGEEDFRLISEEEGYELRFKALELWGELVEKLG